MTPRAAGEVGQTFAGDAPAASGGRPVLFYGWVIAWAGFLVNTLNGALLFHAFGLYVVLLQEDFGWSRTSFAFAFALMRVESGLLGPIEGWAIDRFGPRAVMRFGIVIFGLGLISLSQVDSLLTFYLAFLVMALGSALGSFLPTSVAVVNWFSRRRAAALAILSLGFSAGGLVQPIVVAGLETFGWRGMSVISGLVVWAVALPLTQLIRHRPEDYGYLPDGASPAEAAAAEAEAGEEVSFTPLQALRTRAFWLLGFGHSASLLVFGAVSVHFVAHVTESLGFSLSEAASVITLMTAMMVVGQIVFGGLLGDRVNKRLVIMGAMLTHTAALALLGVATEYWMVIAFAVLNGLAMGTRGPLIQAMRADYFGRASFGTIMGFSSLVMMVGIVTGPVVAGISYDTTGSYRTGFILLAALSGLGSIFFIFVRRPAPPSRGDAPVAERAARPVAASALPAIALAGDGRARSGTPPVPADGAATAGGANTADNGLIADPPPLPAATAEVASGAGDRLRPPRDYMGLRLRPPRDYMTGIPGAGPAAEDSGPPPQVTPPRSGADRRPGDDDSG